MSELPSGWVLASLGDLLIGIETGKSFKCLEQPPGADEVGVVKVSAVSWGTYRENESKTCIDREMINPALYIKSGDFLFSRANTAELVGACVIATQPVRRVMLSDKILRFRFVEDTFKPWILNFLRSDEGRTQIEFLASGNQDSMRNIGQERIRQILVPLPPSAEQTRIVDKLEELLSDLDAGVAELKTAQKKLRQYRQSLLKAAVEGTLTRQWREEQRKRNAPTETGAQLLQRILAERRAHWEAGQLTKFRAQGKALPKDWQKKYPEIVQPDSSDLPTLPGEWAWASVEQLGDVQLGRQRSPGKVGGASPTRYIRAANITESGINLHDILEMDFSKSEKATFALRTGDVLLTEASGSAEHVGRPAIWGTASGLYCFQNTVLRFSPRGMGSAFAFYTFLAMQKLGVFSRLSGGVGINHLSAGKFSKLPVALPPAEEQCVLVELLERNLTLIDDQSQAISHQLRQASAQRRNILRAAFGGQLVRQDANGEPASKLLESIRSKRAVTAGKSQGLKATGSRTRRAPEPSAKPN